MKSTTVSMVIRKGVESVLGRSQTRHHNGIHIKPWIFIGLLILIAYSFSPSLALATQAGDKITFENLTIDDGLSQSSVFAILQDKQGMMWFGTWDGLNRYDGYRFTIYKYNNKNPYSLSNNEIRALYEDSQGILWVGTMEGLNQFDREKERFIPFPHDPDNPVSLAGNRVHAIAEDKKGMLWIGTQEGGLSKFDRHTQQFQHYKHNTDNPISLSHNDVRAICIDAQGIIWIGTWGGGLNRFDPTTGSFAYYQHDPDDPTSLSDNFVRTIYKDREGALWIGTESGGLSRFNRKTQQFTNYRPDKHDPFSVSDKEVISICDTRAGELWVGTRGGGVNKFDRNRQQFISYQPINGNNIWSLYEDRSGILWLGTSEGGVNKALPKHKKFIHYKHNPDDPKSLSGNDVWAIFEDRDGVLWVGVWDHGLNRLERQTETFTHYMPDPAKPNSLSQHDVIAIFEDYAGTMWVGTAEGGLNKFDRRTDRFTHYQHDPNDLHSLAHNFVFSIYEDRQNTLWIGGYLGRSLGRFDRKTETFTNFTHNPENPDSIGNHKVRKLFEDSKGNFWLTTSDGGLCRFDRLTEKFTYYTHDPKNPQTISGNNPTVVFEDHRGDLWIGVWGGGLNKFDRKTETFRAYREQDGLPNDSVMGILEDEKGNLWLSTFRGLSRFNPEKETFTNYTPKDGLQSWEFNSTVAFKGKDGRMFFGGVNGFNAFYPNEIQDNPYIPPVVLTDFKIFNKSVAIGDDSIIKKSIMELNEITLSYQESVFTFEFAALNYISPEKNLYAYKMEGFDQNWRYVKSDRRFVTYTNLDPGTYTFRVKASNNDGLWNEKGKAIKIIITPPWWQTSGFIIFVFVLVSTGLFTGYRWRVNTLKQHSRELAIKVEEKNAAEFKLRKAEKRYRTIADFTYDWETWESPERRILYVSPSCERISGYRPQAFIDDPGLMQEIILPDDRDRWDEHRTNAMKSSLSQEIQFRIRKKDEEIRWIEHACQPVHDVDGEFLGVRASNRDITQRKLTEEALQAKDKMLEEAQNIARLGSWDWNIIKNELAWSDEVYRIFGLSPQEFGATYEAFLERIHPDDYKNVKEAVNRALSDPTADYNILHRIITPEGIERVARERGKVTFDDKGRATRMIGTVQDITDIKIKEAEAQKLRSELAHMDRSGMMGVLTAGIAHEINQPLAAILSNAQAALRFLTGERPDLDEVREALGDIISDDKRAGEMVHSIRNIMGRSELKKEGFDFNETVREVLILVKSEVINRKIFLSERLQPDIPKIYGHHIQIQQVILNLLMNALESLDANRGTASEIVISSRVEENQCVVLSVSDSGPGIKPDLLVSIFDSFHTTKKDGMGVGLSICRSIIEDHGGTIWAENRPEGGAVFFFKLPFGENRDE